MSRTLVRFFVGLICLGLVVTSLGCASSGSSDGYYHRGGSIHRDSFPGGYYGGYGRYGRYGRY
jgi:hypothetical protein